MIKNTILALLCVLFVSGCAASSKSMNKLQLGMSKSQVVEAIGSPDSTSAYIDVEFLTYRLRSDGLFTADYYVRLQNGKVDAFGQAGDFGYGY